MTHFVYFDYSTWNFLSCAFQHVAPKQAFFWKYAFFRCPKSAMNVYVSFISNWIFINCPLQCVYCAQNYINIIYSTKVIKQEIYVNNVFPPPVLHFCTICTRLYLYASIIHNFCFALFSIETLKLFVAYLLCRSMQSLIPIWIQLNYQTMCGKHIEWNK